MTAPRLLSRLIIPLALLALMAGILSCATPVESGPRAWIDWPLDGYEVEPGSTVTLICHAFAQEGVAELHLAVDRNPYRIGQPTQLGEQFVDASIDWLASEPGVYLLSVTAFDTTGASSLPADVTVRVLGEEPTPVLPTEVATTVPPIETASPTVVAPATGTPSPTSPPPPPTGTSIRPTAPPTIVSFQANPPSVVAGGCTRLSWAVEGAISAVYLDTEGVSDHDSRDRCPTSTTTYTLRAVGPGGESTESRTVQVTQPSPTLVPASPTPIPDTQGPPAPNLISPTGGHEEGCGAVTLRWQAVSDPSGVSIYYVKVEQVTGAFKSGGWTTTGTQYTVPAAWLECGQSYRWSVTAEDGRGNMGASSAWGEFTVTMT